MQGDKVIPRRIYELIRELLARRQDADIVLKLRDHQIVQAEVTFTVSAEGE